MQQSAFVVPNLSLADIVSRRYRFEANQHREVGEQCNDPYRFRLLLRFAAINIGGLALIAGAWHEGWLTALHDADGTGLVRLIAAVFLAGLVWCAVRVAETSQELNQLRRPLPTIGSEAHRHLEQLGRAGVQGRQAIETALRHRLAARLTPIRHVASMLVMLGLVGTVVGFVIALSGVDPEAASDVSAVAPMVSTLIDGLGVALHTTLVGAVLNLWLMLDFRVLESGVLRLYTGLLERGATDERL